MTLKKPTIGGLQEDVVVKWNCVNICGIQLLSNTTLFHPLDRLRDKSEKYWASLFYVECWTCSVPIRSIDGRNAAWATSASSPRSTSRTRRRGVSTRASWEPSVLTGTSTEISSSVWRSLYCWFKEISKKIIKVCKLMFILLCKRY